MDTGFVQVDTPVVIPTVISQSDAERSSLAYIKQEWPRLYYALVHHRTTRDQPLTIKDRPWCEAIYKDNSPTIVMVKCVQVGMTELCICAMFSFAEQGMRGMYLLPDDGWVGNWVADRIDGLMTRVPEYRAAVSRVDKETDSRRMKNIYGQTWKFAGTHSKTVGKQPKAAFEFSASALIIDEYDQHDTTALEMFYDRLSSEPNPRVILLGNPTIEGVGISAEYEKSDKKLWYVKCEHCQAEQVLEWEKHFVHKVNDRWTPRDKDLRPVCLSCERPFNRLGAGRWIAAHSERKVSGYKISRLFVGISPDDMVKLYAKFMEAQGNQSALSNFYNQWLGEAYENKDEKVTAATLAACVGVKPEKREEPYARLVAGVDQGKDFHIQISEMIGGRRHKRHIGTQQTWAGVRAVLNEFGVTSVVVDAQGGGYAETRDFVRSFDGAVMCYYRPKDQIKGEYDLKDKEGVVNTNRTEIIDLMVKTYKDKRVVLPPDYVSVGNGDFVSHMLVPCRVLDPRGHPVWTKGTDHYFHADVYEYLAMRISGMSNSQLKAKSWRIT